METKICEEPASALAEHGAVGAAFTVDRIYRVGRSRTGEPVLRERAVAEPWRKDYDAVPGNRPADWPERFDVSSWAILSAWRAGRRVGGVVLAERTLIWDLRVDPALRGTGIGRALFDAAERWIRARGGRRVEVETQNVNVPACRLYESRGCRLHRVDPGAYADFPDEVQLLWQKRLR
jgi:GNAT superfamily N-acetyltransferase